MQLPDTRPANTSQCCLVISARCRKYAVCCHPHLVVKIFAAGVYHPSIFSQPPPRCFQIIFLLYSWVHFRIPFCEDLLSDRKCFSLLCCIFWPFFWGDFAHWSQSLLYDGILNHSVLIQWELKGGLDRKWVLVSSALFEKNAAKENWERQDWIVDRFLSFIIKKMLQSFWAFTACWFLFGWKKKRTACALYHQVFIATLWYLKLDWETFGSSLSNEGLVQLQVACFHWPKTTFWLFFKVISGSSEKSPCGRRKLDEENPKVKNRTDSYDSYDLKMIDSLKIQSPGWPFMSVLLMDWQSDSPLFIAYWQALMWTGSGSEWQMTTLTHPWFCLQSGDPPSPTVQPPLLHLHPSPSIQLAATSDFSPVQWAWHWEERVPPSLPLKALLRRAMGWCSWHHNERDK